MLGAMMIAFATKGSTYRQLVSGPIGNPLSSGVARAVMLDWDLQLLALTSTLGNELIMYLFYNVYKRYIDDQLGLHQATPAGYRWDP